MNTRNRVIVVSIVGIVAVVALMFVVGRSMIVGTIAPIVERVTSQMQPAPNGVSTAANGSEGAAAGSNAGAGAAASSAASRGGSGGNAAGSGSAGTADNVTKEFQPSPFTRVVIDGGWSVTISRSESGSVAVTVPSDVAGDLSVVSSGNVLHIGFSHDANILRGAMSATINAPQIASLQLNGGVKAQVQGFSVPDLTIEIRGAGDVTGTKNTIGHLTIRSAGAANVDFSGSASTNADVYVEGAGNITLNMAGGTLGGQISGLGKVDYLGTVSRQTVDIAGLASVKHKE